MTGRLSTVRGPLALREACLLRMPRTRTRFSAKVKVALFLAAPSLPRTPADVAVSPVCKASDFGPTTLPYRFRSASFLRAIGEHLQIGIAAIGLLQSVRTILSTHASSGASTNRRSGEGEKRAASTKCPWTAGFEQRRDSHFQSFRSRLRPRSPFLQCCRRQASPFQRPPPQFAQEFR
jgi:hypothetical protein